MSSSANIRRFRTNPVEIVIFLAVTLIFVSSVYNLFYETNGFRPVALQPMAANPISEGRTIAGDASATTFHNLELGCQETDTQETTSSKIRLNGPFCGEEPTREPASTGSDEPEKVPHQKPEKAEIFNSANQFHATVFLDAGTGKFSTDYIPLNPGKNPVHIEFSYADGNSFSQDLTITRN